MTELKVVKVEPVEVEPARWARFKAWWLWVLSWLVPIPERGLSFRLQCPSSCEAERAREQRIEISGGYFRPRRLVIGSDTAFDIAVEVFIDDRSVFKGPAMRGSAFRGESCRGEVAGSSAKYCGGGVADLCCWDRGQPLFLSVSHGTTRPLRMHLEFSRFWPSGRGVGWR